VIRRNQHLAIRIIIPRVMRLLFAVCPPERLNRPVSLKCGVLVLQLVVLIVTAAP